VGNGKENGMLAVLRAVEADRIAFSLDKRLDTLGWVDLHNEYDSGLEQLASAARSAGWIELRGETRRHHRLAQLTDAGRKELDRLAAANPTVGHVMVPAGEYETLLHAAGRAASRLAGLDHDAAAELTGALAAIEEGAWRVC
jgi:hypothetical protein